MTMKEMLLLGDSINLHYGPYLNKQFNKHFIIHSKPGRHEALRRIDYPVGGNGGDSSMVLEYLKERSEKGELNLDLFVFNCGLHDIKRPVDGENYQVPPEKYEKNLDEILKLSKKHNLKTIFITTTPVDDERHNKVPPAGIKRYNADVILYNEIATKVCEKHDVAIIDLYTFTQGIDEEKYIDHVHFNDNIRKLQSAYIAGAVFAYSKE